MVGGVGAERNELYCERELQPARVSQVPLMNHAGGVLECEPLRAVDVKQRRRRPS